MGRAGLDAQSCTDIMAHLAQHVPKAMEKAFEEARLLPGIEELRSRLLPQVVDVCERILGIL